MPLSEFNKNRNNKDGLRYNCRECQKDTKKVYMERIKDGEHKPKKRPLTPYDIMMRDRLRLIKRMAIKYQKRSGYVKVKYNWERYMKYSD